MSEAQRPTTLCEAFQLTAALDPDAVVFHFMGRPGETRPSWRAMYGPSRCASASVMRASTSSAERAETARSATSGSAPVWQRYWLDAVALGLAAAFFLITYLTGGFKPANAEGQSISLAFYVFLGPLFLWVGLTLSMQRVVGRQLPRLLALAARALRLGGFGSAQL